MLGALAASRDDQRRLVEDAGHELRTPLTSVRTNLAVLRRHPDLDPATRAKVLDDLHAETEELVGLVEEVVALARGVTDGAPVERVELGELARSVAARAERRHGRAVTVTADDSLVDAPPSAVERAISNLVDNAAKFDPSGQPIEIDVAAGRLVVLDRGPGHRRRPTRRACSTASTAPTRRGRCPGRGSACRSCARSSSATAARSRRRLAPAAGRASASPSRSVDADQVRSRDPDRADAAARLVGDVGDAVEAHGERHDVVGRQAERRRQRQHGARSPPSRVERDESPAGDRDAACRRRGSSACSRRRRPRPPARTVGHASYSPSTAADSASVPPPRGRATMTASSTTRLLRSRPTTTGSWSLDAAEVGLVEVEQRPTPARTWPRRDVADRVVVVEQHDLVGVDVPLLGVGDLAEPASRWRGRGRGSRAARRTGSCRRPAPTNFSMRSV